MFPMYLGIYLRKILWSPCTFRGILPWNVPTPPRNFPKEDPQVALHFSYRCLLLPKENPEENPYVALHFPKVLGFLTTDCPKVVRQFTRMIGPQFGERDNPLVVSNFLFIYVLLVYK